MPRYRTGSRHQPQYRSATLKKISPKQVAENIDAEAEVVICCEADERLFMNNESV